ncbi:hypothetical protein IJF81_04415 [bacterium]|nr:hypothetical protein [bacterium]
MTIVISNYIPKLYSNNGSKNIEQNIRTSPYPNLAPLNSDTINFTAGPKIFEGYAGGVANLKTIQQIRKDAFKYAAEVKQVLKDYLEPLIATPEFPDRPIIKIGGRIKTANSIQRKAHIRHCRSKDEILRDVEDIIGFRIITKDTKKSTIELVVKKLTEAVKNNDLKIFEIENYYTEAKADRIPAVLFSKMQQYGNKLRSKGFSYRSQSLPSGYSAIHSTAYIDNGYKTEIQIVSEPVERVKSIEDFFYKAKNSVPLETEYKVIEDNLKELGNNHALQRSATAYTKWLYNAAREGVLPKKGFPQAPEYIPPKLDFNYIAKLKAKCDKEAKLAEKASKKS